MQDNQGREENVPFNFQLFVYVPGRRVYGFHFVLDPRAAYKAGVLERITDIFARMGIPILHYAVSFSLNSPIHGVIFADFSDAGDFDVREVLLALSRISYVLDVRLIKSLFEGFVFDQYFFPIMIGKERGVIFLRRGYEGFIKRAREQYGSGFSTTLYLRGYEMGSLSYLEDYMKITGEDPEKLIKVVEALFQYLGFGILQVKFYDFERGVGTVRIYNSFECELFKGSDKPQSHFIRGMIAGWVSQMLKKEVEVIETKCIAKGDPYCEFQIKPSKIQK